MNCNTPIFPDPPLSPLQPFVCDHERNAVNLAIGMLVSVKANTQAEALQASLSIMLPTIFLSGYVFPRATMPLLFFILSYFVRATYMIEIFRGIILRGAGFVDLWIHALALAVIGITVLLIAAKRFSRMIV